MQQFDILEPVFSLDPDEYEYADYTVEVEYEDQEQSDAGIDIFKNIESLAEENEIKIPNNNNNDIPISSPNVDENQLNNVPEIIQSSNDESILEVYSDGSVKPKLGFSVLWEIPMLIFPFFPNFGPFYPDFFIVKKLTRC